ncbi:MAG: CpsD/CapB family tyrosine-protein kinase [Candidatus Izemoplasmataceae bacterium]
MALEYKVITNKDPHHVVSEQYRKLKTNIDFSVIDTKIQVISLTSTFPREGKTITALNLATVYAQSKKKTLIIDLDLRKPKLHRAFGISNEFGLGDHFAENKDIFDLVHEADEYLDVLVAGTKIPFPAEVLESKQMKHVIDKLRTKYDKIIIDAPPLTAVADATIISRFVDGTVFVVGSRKTNADVAKTVLKELEQTGGKILGGIMTQVQKRDLYNGMDFYYYYGED